MYLIEKGKNANTCGKNMHRDANLFFQVAGTLYNRNRKYSVPLSVNTIANGHKQMNIMHLYFGTPLCWMPQE